jgi:hypothetical protein
VINNFDASSDQMMQGQKEMSKESKEPTKKMGGKI